MAVTLTSIARVRNWQALRRLHGDTLIGQVREAGATRYRVYRNVNDASQVLVIVEHPDHDALHELAATMEAQINALLEDDEFDVRVWELAGWDGIG